MAKTLCLPQDPRWLLFAQRYAPDPARFAVEVQGLLPSQQQLALFAGIAPSQARLSVASGHGTGKTTAIASIVLWHLLCYPQSITLLTANDMDQVKVTLWKEISSGLARIERGIHAWIAPYVEILANATARIRGFERTWLVESKTANDKTANKMAGRHGEWLLIVADEAATLSDTVLTTLTGALTERHNRMLMTSQPTRNAGFFYRSHHDLAVNHGGLWQPLVFSSIDSPFVSDSALQALWAAYDTDERNVRLLGRFPQDASKQMMPLSVAEAMYGYGQIIADDEAAGWLLLADVASGEGQRDKSVAVIARVIGYGDSGENARRVEISQIPLHTNNIRANQLAPYLMEAADAFAGIGFVVDAGGLGIHICQDIEDAGKPLHRVYWGNPCFRQNNRQRYLNLRAQAMHHAARAAKEGRLSVRTDAYRTVMLAQSSRIPKTFTDKGRLKVPPKGSAEWEGLNSPDLWDAVCFAFLESVDYVPANQGNTTTQTLAQTQAAIDALFA